MLCYTIKCAYCVACDGIFVYGCSEERVINNYHNEGEAEVPDLQPMSLEYTGSITGNFSNTFCDRECSTPVW